MGEWFYKYRNPFLVAVIFLGYLLHASNGIWVDDFWDHSAVVSELIRHPWQPQHPQLGSDLPHVFFTPYSLLVAMVAKLCHLNAVESLSLFGIINLGLLLYGVKIFINTNYLEQKSATYFYSLLLILYLWGGNPWNYSGFFHSNILNYSLPYPSAFATGLAFIAISFNNQFYKTRKNKYLIGVLLITACVAITHAVAFIFLCVGLVAGTLAQNKDQIKSAALLISIVACALCSALVWPYYPYLDLIMGAANVYHPSNKGVYDNLLLTIWPILITIPLTINTIDKEQSRKILIIIILLSVIYILAWFTNKYSYGRIISYVIILIQIVLAQSIAKVENLYIKNKNINKYICISMVLVALWAFYPVIKASITRIMTLANNIVHGRQILNQQTFGYLALIKNKIEPGGLILANARTSWMLPTFDARIITLTLPHAFIKDHNERFTDVEDFFSTSTKEEDRILIIKKYHPKYILIDKYQDAGWLKIENILNKSKTFDSVFEDEKIKLYVERE